MTAYQFRELNSTDLFPMFGILNKIGFRKFKDCFQSDDVKNAGKNKNLESVGLMVVLDIAGIIIENLPSCEEDIYKMLANVSNLKKEEIQKLSLADFAQMIIDFVQKPDFKDFFKVVSKLFKSEI